MLDQAFEYHCIFGVVQNHRPATDHSAADHRPGTTDHLPKNNRPPTKGTTTTDLKNHRPIAVKNPTTDQITVVKPPTTNHQPHCKYALFIAGFFCHCDFMVQRASHEWCRS